MIRKFILTLFLSLGLLTTLFGQDTLWLRRFDRGNSEWGLDIVLDGIGNPIVGGYFWNTTTNNYDVLLIKYTPNGDTIWTRYYDSGESECLYRVTLDRQGNIICAGWSSNDTIEAQCLVIKFSPDGNFMWERKYRIRDIDIFCDVTIDDSNNVSLAGYSYSYSGGGDLIGFFRKYDGEGNLIWTKFYDWSDEFYGIITSQDGSLFVFATGTDTLWQMLTVRLNSFGDTLWTRKLSWGGRDCRGWGIALDSFGNIIVAGYLRNVLTFDWGIVKYTQTGDTIWARTADFTPNDWATDVATDVFGNIYVCGNVGLIDTIGDYLLIKYNPSGDTIWTKRYDNGYNDVAYGVVVDNYGNPIVTGYSSNGTNNDIVTIKYRGTSGIEESSTFDAKRFTLEVYPNPAKTVMRVRVPMSVKEETELKIFDVSGKLIKEIATPSARNDRNGEIKVSLKGISPGIYFLRLGKETTKFLVVK
jgi:hypothetical protein